MLSTEKIANAFKAIVEEADRLSDEIDPGKINEGLKTICSIARHQNDIRSSTKGSCSGHGE